MKLENVSGWCLISPFRPPALSSLSSPGFSQLLAPSSASYPASSLCPNSHRPPPQQTLHCTALGHSLLAHCSPVYVYAVYVVYVYAVYVVYVVYVYVYPVYAVLCWCSGWGRSEAETAKIGNGFVIVIWEVGPGGIWGECWLWTQTV